jgi:hypothetical protein
MMLIYTHKESILKLKVLLGDIDSLGSHDSIDLLNIDEDVINVPKIIFFQTILSQMFIDYSFVCVLLDDLEDLLDHMGLLLAHAAVLSYLCSNDASFRQLWAVSAIDLVHPHL